MDYAARKAYPYRPPSDLTVQEIERCIVAGMRSWDAAKVLNVRRAGLLRQCRRLGIRWVYDPADRAEKRVWARGRWWSYSQIAREIGAGREIIRRRHFAGDEGERLFRPVEGRPSMWWEVGLSIEEWKEIVDAARRSGVSEACRLFGVPQGAVCAAMRGEWERIG